MKKFTKHNNRESSIYHNNQKLREEERARKDHIRHIKNGDIGLNLINF